MGLTLVNQSPLWDVEAMLKMFPLKLIVQTLVLTVQRFVAKNGWVMCSHIAMSMMLALFPFVLFTVALAGAVATLFSQSVAIDDLVDLVFGGWPEAVSQPLLTELYAVLNASNTQLMTLGGLLALYFSSNGVNAIRTAMISAYGAADDWPIWKSRLLCFAFVIVGGVMILFTTLFEVALPLSVRFLSDYLPWDLAAMRWASGINGLVLWALPVLSVLACHLFLPVKRLNVRQILPGVLVTVALWWAAATGFAIYVGRFAQYSATYAGLAGAMAAMIFLYVLAAVLVFGAEFNGALAKLKSGRSSQDLSQPKHGYTDR